MASKALVCSLAVLAILLISSEFVQGCRPTSKYEPVCASNGETYQNSGHFFCAVKWLKPDSTVTIVHQGECVDDESKKASNS